MRLIEDIKDLDVTNWVFFLFVPLPLFTLLAFALVSLGMFAFHSSVGKADYCYVMKVSTGEADVAVYAVKAHVPWGADLMVGTFGTPEQAAEFARTQCLVNR